MITKWNQFNEELIYRPHKVNQKDLDVSYEWWKSLDILTSINLYDKYYPEDSYVDISEDKIYNIWKNERER